MHCAVYASNGSINQSIKLHEHVPMGVVPTLYTLQSKKRLQLIVTYIYTVHILYKIIELKRHIPQNSSFHFIWASLWVSRLQLTCPFITLFTRLPSFSITFSLHTSLLLFTCAINASYFNLSLITSFLTQPNLVTPTTLLRTSISVACNLV